MDLPPVLGHRYRVLHALAVGGMGGVYEVEHLVTHEHFALKVMLKGHDDPTLVTRFRREAAAAASIMSEHVIRVVEVDAAPELDGRLFLVMELLSGIDLAHHLAQRHRLPPLEVLAHVAQTGDALSAAHAAGIVHRDLKPQNLFLHEARDGHTIVKLLDFGVARLLDPDATEVTDRGAPIGTIRYTSPEQFSAGSLPIGPETDMWALGLITLELLVGVIYWRSRSTRAVVEEILRGPTEPPSVRWPELGPAFDAWFAQACAVHPSQRFRSVREQVMTLGPILLGMRHGPQAETRR